MFRKFFDTTCTTAEMNPVYTEMLMGHNLGLKSRYAKPSPIDLLEGNDKNLGYSSVINELTINEEHRLRREVEVLAEKRNEIQLMKESHEQELKAMREEMQNKFQQILTKIDPGKLDAGG